MTTTHITFTPTHADDVNVIEYVLDERWWQVYGHWDDDGVTPAEVNALRSLIGMVEGTQLPRSLRMTYVERVALMNALAAWHDNQTDDEGDGADHHDEIVQLQRLAYELMAAV